MKNRFIDNSIPGLCMMCAFLLPWNFLVSPVAGLIVVCWLCSGDWKQKLEHFRQSKIAGLFIAFLFLSAAGIWWSSNRVEAFTNFEVKLPMFLFPVIFASLRFNFIFTKRILQALLAGLVAAGSFMIGRSLYVYVMKHESAFSYQDFSDGLMHPSYLSLYFVIGIMICFHGILLQDVPVKKKAIAVALTAFFCLIIFMLASKTGIISLVIVFMFYIGYAVVRFRRYVVAGVALAGMIIAFFIALSVFPTLKSRLTVMTEVLSSDAPINPADVESNRVRILIWACDLELIGENLMTGVGTGDVQDELMKKYAEAGMTGALDKKLNAHSQYFQTGIALGLPGLILLMGIFLTAFTWAVRSRYGFAALFTVLLAFNYIPESMLQVQAGTFMLGFFFAFILFAADPAVLSPKSKSPEV